MQSFPCGDRQLTIPTIDWDRQEWLLKQYGMDIFNDEWMGQICETPGRCAQLLAELTGCDRNRLTGDAFELGFEALARAVADFFPAARKQTLLKNFERIQTAAALVHQKAMQELEKPIDVALIWNAGATSSADSSEASTPLDSVSASSSASGSLTNDRAGITPP